MYRGTAGAYVTVCTWYVDGVASDPALDPDSGRLAFELFGTPFPLLCGIRSPKIPEFIIEDMLTGGGALCIEFT